MSDTNQLPESVRALLGGPSQDDRLDGFALHALVRAADENGVARIRDVAANYRNDYLRVLRAKGLDAEREAGEARSGRGSRLSRDLESSSPRRGRDYPAPRWRHRERLGNGKDRARPLEGHRASSQ